MRDELEKRHKELKVEFETGQKLMAELDTRQANLRQSLLRISGAIQVLEELLSQERAEEQKSELPIAQRCSG